MSLKTVLIVEDEEELAVIIKKQLEAAGYQAFCAYTGKEALELLNRRFFSVILLDVLLPDVTGDILCGRIREITDAPVIFTSCMSDRKLIARALACGGDDYMIKPVDYEELLARIAANLRRSGEEVQGRRTPSYLAFRRFIIDVSRHHVIWLKDHTILELSPTEYAILIYMVKHENQLLTYEDLYREIWKTDSLGDVRTVMVHVSNLRKKLDRDKCGIIETVRSAGYIFNNI